MVRQQSGIFESLTILSLYHVIFTVSPKAILIPRTKGGQRESIKTLSQALTPEKGRRCSERTHSRNAAQMEISQVTNLPKGPALHSPSEKLET